MANNNKISEDSATNQVDSKGRFKKGNKPKAGFHTNPENINKGGWKKEDTPRYKLEQMMKLSEMELSLIIEDDGLPLFERRLAKAIIKGDWGVIRQIIHEVYGTPKDSIDLNAMGEGIPIIKGFVLPTAPEDFIDETGKQKAQE